MEMQYVREFGSIVYGIWSGEEPIRHERNDKIVIDDKLYYVDDVIHVLDYPAHIEVKISKKRSWKVPPEKFGKWT